MAKPWAKKFYDSKLWKLARNEARRRDHYTCVRCGARGTEVHHKIELTPENITDQKIALDQSNLETLCRDCHNRETKGSAATPDEYMFDEHGQVVRM